MPPPGSPPESAWGTIAMQIAVCADSESPEPRDSRVEKPDKGIEPESQSSCDRQGTQPTGVHIQLSTSSIHAFSHLLKEHRADRTLGHENRDAGWTTACGFPQATPLMTCLSCFNSHRQSPSGDKHRGRHRSTWRGGGSACPPGDRQMLKDHTALCTNTAVSGLFPHTIFRDTEMDHGGRRPGVSTR